MDRGGRACQIADVGTCRGDICHAMTPIQHARGFDDRWYGPVWSGFPRRNVEFVGCSGNMLLNLLQQLTKRIGTGVEDLRYAVPDQGPLDRPWLPLGRNEDRHNRMGARSRMEIQNVEGIIFHLLSVQVGEGDAADFELQYEHTAISQ